MFIGARLIEQTITPTLMFVGDQFGRAKEAIETVGPSTPPPVRVPPTDTLPTDPQFTSDRWKDHLASSEQASRLLTHSFKIS
jgi:hypothetical protein